MPKPTQLPTLAGHPARAVGPGGKVYAQNNRFVLEKLAEGPWSERLARPGLGAVVRLDRELEDPGLPAGQLDAVMLVLFYHDTVSMGTDRRAMLTAAGFVLDGDSALLRHAEDDRGRNVFDPALRGRSDQFVLRFRKSL